MIIRCAAYKKLVRKWNVFAANQAVRVVDSSRARGKKERNMGQFELHGIIVIVVSLGKSRHGVEYFVEVIEKVLEAIKQKDSVGFSRVQKYVRYVCISDSFRRMQDYDVYSKALYLKEPLQKSGRA